MKEGEIYLKDQDKDEYEIINNENLGIDILYFMKNRPKQESKKEILSDLLSQYDVTFEMPLMEENEQNKFVTEDEILKFVISMPKYRYVSKMQVVSALKYLVELGNLSEDGFREYMYIEI